jgi:HAD superfamily hydrolase (TIGR01549 family)
MSALWRIGADGVPVEPLVAAFRVCPGVREALARLRTVVRTGLVTDGETGGQRAKVRALGLEDLFDVIVYSDDLGRSRRKPHPAPFQHALARLGVPEGAAVMIGDLRVPDISQPVQQLRPPQPASGRTARRSGRRGR